MIQAVLFDKQHWSTDAARKWLKNKGYVPIKRIHVTDNYLRYRLQQPIKTNYITKDIGNHIKLIIQIS